MKPKYFSFRTNERGGNVMKKRIMLCALSVCMLLSSAYLSAYATETIGTFGSVGLMADETVSGNNMYGHTITYKPVTHLYAGRRSSSISGSDGAKDFMLFDATGTKWYEAEKNIKDAAQANRWLTVNQYMLNDFFRFFSGYGYESSWNNRLPSDYFTGKISLNNNGYEKWNASFGAPSLSYDKKYDPNGIDFGCFKHDFINSTDTGNIYSMLGNGEIEYLFAYKVKTVQTGWGLFFKSNDYGRVHWITDKEYRGNAVSAENYSNGKPHFGSLSGWRNAEDDYEIIFAAFSDRDSQNDCYLYDGMIIGRDIQGPTIRNVYISKDKAGKEPICDGITLDMLRDGTIKDRTVYIQTEWSEPVRFNFDNNFTEEDLEDLTLKVQTLGTDGTSGAIAEAPFLSFAPAKTDSTQLMTFEYKIQDPYKDNSPIVQERGTYYSFSKVSVDTKENATLWNYITDLSGNKFNANRLGEQPATTSNCTIDGSPYVDLEPFAVKSISVTKDTNPDEQYVLGGELLTVNVKFNKHFSPKSFRWVGGVTNQDNFSAFPELTFNIKDENGNYVEINYASNRSPIKKKGYNGEGWVEINEVYPWPAAEGLNLFPASPKEIITVPYGIAADIFGPNIQYPPGFTLYGTTTDTLSYNIQLYPGYTMDGDSIHIKSMKATNGSVDDSGYKLLDYTFDEEKGLLVPDNLPAEIVNSIFDSKINKYSIAADKQYKVDFEGPEITPTFDVLSDEVIRVKAEVALKAALEEGSEAKFDFALTGIHGDAVMQYQVSTDGSYNDGDWVNVQGDGTSFSVSSPILVTNQTGESFVILKISGNKGEISAIRTKVTVTDMAKNTASVTADGQSEYDKAAPRISIKSWNENHTVTVDDANADGFYFAWTEAGEAEPEDGAYTFVSDNSSVVPSPTLPEENKVFTKILWVKATDSMGNESQAISKICKFDRSHSDIVLTVDDPQKVYYGTDYPKVTIDMTNVKEYYYTWVEVPANYNTSSGDYGNAEDYLASDYIRQFTTGWNAPDEYTDLRGLYYPNKYITDIPDEDPEIPGTQNNISFTESVHNRTAIVSVFNNDDLKWGNHPANEEGNWDYNAGDYKYPDEVSGAIMLIVAARDGHNNWIYKTIQLDTALGDSPIEVRQSRFSTGDTNGVRVDYKRVAGDKKGLYWADDQLEGLKPINNTLLGNIAEAEFYISADPITGFEKIDMNNSSIQLVKVGFNGYNILEDEDVVTTLKEWKLSDLNLTQRTYGTYKEDDTNATIGGTRVGLPCSPTYMTTVSFDPKIINPALSEFYTNENGENGERLIRYEFRFKRVYKGGNAPEDEIEKVSYFAFNNYINGSSGIYGVSEIISPDFNDSFSAKLKEAVFDNNGEDITQNVPIIFFKGTEAELYVKLENVYDECRLVKYAPREKLMGSSFRVNYGTEPDKLSYSKEEAEYFGSDYIGPFIFDENGAQLRIYYQFEETIKGVKSPICVIDVRRDEIGPTVNLSVSETEKKVGEVLVKVESIYDAHEAAGGIMITDTPATKLDKSRIYARRIVCDGEVINTTDPNGENYVIPDDIYTDEYGREIVTIYPDESGVYRFTNNGYILADIYDEAMNWATIYVNGKEVAHKPYEELIMYRITNIDKEAPLFNEAPVFTENHEKGSFTVTAKVGMESESTFKSGWSEDYGPDGGGDYEPALPEENIANDVKDIYIAFDNDYSELININSGNKGTILENVSGIADYSFNRETGELSAEVYAKYNEDSTPITSATVILVDEAGNMREFTHSFDTPVLGVKPMVTNSRDEISGNVNRLPVLGYEEALSFNVPVSIPEYHSGLNTEHTGLPIYADGSYEITYYDIFDTEYTEYIYSNVSSEAFAHKVNFTADGENVNPSQKTNKDIKVTIDTSGTEYLYVGSGTDTVYEETLTENDVVTYTLHNLANNESRTFNISVSGIDKTAPEAVVSVGFESGDNGTVLSATYTVVGFTDDSNVEMLANETGEIASEYTFNNSNKGEPYTFKFRDEAGNEGSYTANPSEYTFADYTDKTITGYRLSYYAASKTGVSRIGSIENDDLQIDAGSINGDISVKVEALNANGEAVPFTISDIGSSSGVLAVNNTIMFVGEDSSDRTAKIKLSGDEIGNELMVEVTLQGGSIDKTSPTGYVEYMSMSDETIRIYLVTNDTDIADGGVSIKGEKEDGTLLSLKKDDRGYYVDTDTNVSGHFILTDKAGNIGSVAMAVIGIDNTPPEKKTEGWSSVFEADTEELIERLLNTPTNCSIKIFFSFNEQLGKTEVYAYDNLTDKNSLTPTEQYVTAVTSGNTVVIEFKQNCVAKIDVFDMSGNSLTLWRPEDGPITVIDKDAPKLLEGYPQINIADNKVTMVYKFDEDVMLLTAEDKSYKNEHTVVFADNGQQILTFTDKAGNVFSTYPIISEIDDLAPVITFCFDEDTLKNIEYSEAQDGTLTFGTNEDVVVRIKMEDATPDGLTVKAEDLKGKMYNVVPETKTITDENNASVTYTHKFVASDNGTYNITATDKWGQENTLRLGITMIDRAAPTINMVTAQEVKVMKNADASDVQREVLTGVTAKDNGCGVADNGLTVDLSNVNLTKVGSYIAKINVCDKLGNTATKTRVVVVYDEALRLFNINNEFIEENDVYLMQPGRVNVSTDADSFKNEKITLYYSQGYKTKAQMKYASPLKLAEGFDATEKGYYTILAQSAERGMYLVYIYVH